MSRRYEVWADPELAFLARADAGLLAIADAVAETGRLRRNGARRTTVRVGVLAAAVLVVAAVLAGTAFGLHLGSIISFGGSSSAPEPVQHQFSEYNQGAPPGLSPDAIAGQTRVITTVELGGRSHTLYVSPTTEGGFCYEWTDAAGGCDQFGTTPLNITWGTMIGGTIASAYVSTVKIEFSDRGTAEPDITWISDPINAGFFLYQPPAGETAAWVDGYDKSGRLVARQPLLGQPFDDTQPPPFARTTDEHVVATLTTPDGPATVTTAPSATDGLCAWIDLDGANTPIYGDQGCLPHNYTPQGVTFRFIHNHDSIIFIGSAASTYSRITLQLPNGTTTTITPTADGLLFYSLPAAIAKNPSKFTVTAYHADGKVAFSDPIQP